MYIKCDEFPNKKDIIFRRGYKTTDSIIFDMN